MFVQIIEGRTEDPGGLRERWQAWEREQQPKAAGFRGGTAGVTDDGRFVAIARFESDVAAKENSDRPEQGEWWATVEPLVSDVTFTETTDVRVVGEPSDDAGFVQVIQGRATDRERLRELADQLTDELAEQRPDVLGWLEAWSGDRLTQVVYFSSEEEARAAERAEAPDEADEWRTLIEDVSFTDLREPWLH